MDIQLAQMFNNMLESVHDEYEMQKHMHKNCRHCKSEETSFDKNSGTYDCYDCMKSFV